MKTLERMAFWGLLQWVHFLRIAMDFSMSAATFGSGAATDMLPIITADALWTIHWDLRRKRENR
jgi:hypothetical protein